MTIPSSAVGQRPANPKLAKLFDQALQKGSEIRYVDDGRLVIAEQLSLGGFGCLVLIILGLLTAFIVPIILLALGALKPAYKIVTYTLKPNGSIKRKISKP